MTSPLTWTGHPGGPEPLTGPDLVRRTCRDPIERGARALDRIHPTRRTRRTPARPEGMTRTYLHRILATIGILLLTLAPPLEAQQASRGGAALTSPERILERLRDSGLTRSQVQTRLSSLGVDPALADPWFDRLRGQGTGTLPLPDESFVAALVRMGLLEAPPVAPDSLSLPSGAGVVPDSLLEPRPDSVAPEEGLQIFGKATFARRTTQFQPLLTGPVPPDYRLGPGDELSLVLTGDVELAYTLPVTREGTIVIPDVGQVAVNGLTLGELEDRLFDRLGRVYSGVRRSAEATTRFQLSVGRLRLNEVFVIGEVEYPGSYEVSSLSTALGALYRAGGPNAQGSFRSVQLRRGGEPVAAVDLYDYLLSADTRDDARLEHGDVVFVPVAGPRVRVEGAVPRNAIFEVRPGESLQDVLVFAGGVDPEADVERIRIDRILPPGERTAARQRTLVDVDLEAVRASDALVPLHAGDRIRVPPIGDERRDRVVLAGSVYAPGTFELTPGMTLRELIARGGGLRPDAFRPVAHVTRLVPEDSTYALRRVSLEVGADGTPLDDLRLEDQDSVTVFGRATLGTPRHVRVEGEVKEPDEYLLTDGMTVEDAILSAGGFTERAQGLEVEVARLDPGLQRTDTVARTFPVSMEGTIPWEVLGRDLRQADPDRSPSPGAASGADVVLQEGDRVIVRPLPGFVEDATVEVRGEVRVPGRYPLLEREERLSSLVRRAGGFTDDAYVDGAHMLRDSTLVGIDLAEILENPGSDADIVLRPDDILNVPLYDGTVLVEGAVAFDTRVIYDRGLSFEDYVRRAGGAVAEADMDRANILYANGERAVADDFLLFFTDFPDVEPGSVITVPYEREATGTDWNSVITQGLGLVGSIATLLVAITR